MTGRGRPYAYQEYPKWLHSPNGSVIVQNAEEERRIRWERARDIGREKANTVQRVRADALAAELVPGIAALRTRGCSLRDIADALNRRHSVGARPPVGTSADIAAAPPGGKGRCNRCGALSGNTKGVSAHQIHRMLGITYI